MNHGDNDWLTNDDDGVWWFNLDVMVDELVIIMRCSVIWNSKIYVLSMISKYYVLYVYDGACLCFSIEFSSIGTSYFLGVLSFLVRTSSATFGKKPSFFSVSS